MKEETWTKFLRGLSILLRKDHLFIKREWQAYYYVDRKDAFLVFPETEGKYIIKNTLPSIRSLDMQIDYPEGSEINDRVGSRFLKYAEKYNFRL